MSEKQLALEPIAPAEIQASQSIQTTPMHLLELAVSRGADMETVERLVKLQERMLDREAELQFNEALNRCQAKMTRVARDMENPQTHSRYSSYAALDRALRPTYTGEGFSVSFGEAESTTAELVVMLAYVSRGGHTRIYRKVMPVDTKGPKGNDVMTKTHASGSAGSYAKRYLLKDVFNLSEGEDDDDGNGGDSGQRLTPSALDEWCDYIKTAANIDQLKGRYQEAQTAANNIKDTKSLLEFGEVKNSRYKELAVRK